MQAAIYGYWASLPSKITATMIALASLFATLKPNEVNAWIAWLMTPQQVQLLGGVGIIVVLAWLVILLLLKPKGNGKGTDDGPIAITTGESSPALAGQFGDIHFHSTPSPSPVPSQSYVPDYGNLDVLIRVLETREAPKTAAADIDAGARVQADMPFNAVLVRIYRKLGGAPDEPNRKRAFYEQVDRELSKGVRGNKMTVWGFYGKRGPERLAVNTLEKGWFDHKEGAFILPSLDTVNPMRFQFLEFNQAQVDRVWPK